MSLFNNKYAISQLQIVRSGLRLVTYLNHCSRCGQLFAHKVAHILWWRHDNRKQSASARERWCDVDFDIPYSPVRTPGGGGGGSYVANKSSVSPACRKRRLNGAVSRNKRIKRVAPCWCLDGTLKNPTKCLWRLESDRRYYFLTCRHIYDWNIVEWDVNQPISLSSHSNVKRDFYLDVYIYTILNQL